MLSSLWSALTGIPKTSTSGSSDPSPREPPVLPTSTPLSSPPAHYPHTPPSKDASFQRSRRQLTLFFAGAGFLALSTLITRRAIVRKQLSTYPKFFQPTSTPGKKFEHNPDGGAIAVEALSLATLNCVSFFMMLTGGTMWAFDISNLEDLRKRTQKHIHESAGQISEEDEREIEAWMMKMLGREAEEVAKPAPDKAEKDTGS